MSLIPTLTEFRGNQWYGIKEDATAENGGRRPQVSGCVFIGNGYDYYHEELRDITMDELNAIVGNGENRRGE